MTLSEYIATEKRFNKLFEKRCKNIPFNSDEQIEYLTLSQKLADHDTAKVFHEIIARGDYRIGQ